MPDGSAPAEGGAHGGAGGAILAVGEGPGSAGPLYEELFAWRVRTGGLTSVEAGVTGRLRLLDTDGAIPGLIASEEEPGGVELMVDVDDLESVLANAARLGARLGSRETFELAGAGDEDGRYVLADFADPEGNRVVLVAASSD